MVMCDVLHPGFEELTQRCSAGLGQSERKKLCYNSKNLALFEKPVIDLLYALEKLG